MHEYCEKEVERSLKVGMRLSALFRTFSRDSGTMEKELGWSFGCRCSGTYHTQEDGGVGASRIKGDDTGGFKGGLAVRVATGLCAGCATCL